MPNKYSAAEMYCFMLNGRAWRKNLSGWRMIEPVKIVSAKVMDKVAYPIFYRSLVRDGKNFIDEKTLVANADEEKYWSMADVVIYFGLDLNVELYRSEK